MYGKSALRLRFTKFHRWRRGMNKFSISVDSVADLSPEMTDYLGVSIIPFSVKLSGGVLYDRVVQSDELKAVFKSAKTAEGLSILPPSREQYEEFFDNLAEDYGYIIHICQGSLFSSAHLNALYAAKNTMTKYYGSTVYVIDGHSTSAGLANLVEFAVNMRNKGYSADDTFVELLEMRPKIEQHVITKDLVEFNAQHPSGVGRMAIKTNSVAVISVDDIGKPVASKRCASTSAAIGVVSARYSAAHSSGTVFVNGSTDLSLLLKTVALMRKKNAADIKMSTMGLCNSLLFGEGSVFLSFLGKPPKSREKPKFNPGKSSDFFDPEE